jgi:hypothetical protein
MTVADEQSLEEEADGARTLRFSRRTKLPPGRSPMVEEHSLNEVLGFLRIGAVSCTNECDNALDEIELRQKELFTATRGPSWLHRAGCGELYGFSAGSRRLRRSGTCHGR